MDTTATSAESLHQGYLEVVQQLQIPGWEEKRADVKKLVQEYLNKDDAGRWLLVFDNADDVDLWIATPTSWHEDEQESLAGFLGRSHRLIDYLPKNKQGSIIFTTRDRKTAVKLAQQNIVDVPAMSEEAAMQLLRKCLANPDLVENKQGATALLRELTYLPLAVVQATAYINENSIAIADYLSLLEEKEEEIISLLSADFEDDGRYHNVKNPVATTWLISFQQIRRHDPLSVAYLSFVACVNPKDIPQPLLPPGPSRKREIDAIGTLTAYSFVSRRPMDLALDVHRLVHLATRNWLRKEGLLAQSTERAIVRLEEMFPDNSHQNRSIWRIYLPHVRYVLESDLVSKDGKSRMALMWRYGLCLCSDGRWNEAEESFSQVLEIHKKKLGADHPNTLTTMANLAVTYSNQGREDEAEKLIVQVVEIRKKKLGADHPDTLITMHNLAATYSNQGRQNEAEKLMVQVVEILKKKLGADHPATLTSMANLAVTYARFKGADRMKLRSLRCKS